MLQHGSGAHFSLLPRSIAYLMHQDLLAPVDGHGGCFTFLTISNKVHMNTRVQGSMRLYAFISRGNNQVEGSFFIF